MMETLNYSNLFYFTLKDQLDDVKSKQAELSEIYSEQSHLCHRPDPDLDSLDLDIKDLADAVQQLTEACKEQLVGAERYLETRIAVEEVLNDAEREIAEMEKDDFMSTQEKLQKHEVGIEFFFMI